MKTRILGLGLALSAAILTGPAVAADHADSSLPGSARPTASLGNTTRRAAIEFVDAYANRNPAALAHATTGDFEVQYALPRTGTYVTVDEDALVTSWREAGVNSSAGDGHPTVAVFPTADAQAVFVTYRLPGDAGGERIALLELRGDRVARARDLVGPAPEFLELDNSTKGARTVAADRNAPQGR